MRRPVFPAAIRGRPHSTALFLGALLLATVSVAYGVGFALLTPQAAARVLVVDLAVAAIAATVAFLVGRGHVDSMPALDYAAAVVLASAYAAVLNELAAAPDRAAQLTAHGCITVSAVGVVIRRRPPFAALVLTAPVAWWVTVSGLDAPGFDPSSWLPTWGFTLAVAAALYTLMATEGWTANASFGRAEQLATIDDLTGLSNRRGLTQRATQLAALAHRRHDTLWCAFLDVDGFKSLNDTQGHLAGDQVLVATARALEQVARAADVVARWGGDEFVVLGLGEPPGPGQLEARVTTALGSSTRGLVPTWVPGVTIGVAVVRAGESATALEDLLAEADARMYERRSRSR